MKKITLILCVLLGIQTLSRGQNLLDMQGWTVGTGGTGAFGANGGVAENFREWGIGPQGQRAIVWRAKPDGNANDDGGFNYSPFAIDHTKMYRFSIWLKKTNSNDGISYFGTEYAGDLDGSAHINPYFWYGDLPELNKWYLLVGYVHGSGDASTTHYGGIYDGLNGEKVGSATDFKFAPGAVQTYIRSYLYYDPNVNDEQYFYAPRVEVVDGNEPSIEGLISAGKSLNNRSNWVTNGATKDAVVTHLGWQYYGNNHTIMDMSKGLAPDGTAHNSVNPEGPWQLSYPTLMGWNGTNTYGVRVDNARIADNASALTNVAATNSIRINTPVGNAIPALGGLDYKLYLANGQNDYGMQFGILNNGSGFIQQQRGDGGATAYNLFFNPSGGNVAIGTTDPKGKLTVNGKVHVYQSEADAAGLTIQGNTVNTDFAQHYVALTLDGDYGNGLGNYSQIRSYSNLYHSWGTRLAFFTTSSATSNSLVERMRIDANGNVGIGVTSPAEKLTVNGKIKANEIRVDGAGAPDYVFEPGYKVATLEALESYIKANKHLPEVPSAREFERDGIAVGEMNKLLLKKIEELTLHLIDKDKALSKQQEMIDGQEQRLKTMEKEHAEFKKMLLQIQK